MEKPFAEIIESSCSKFLAQSWDEQGEPLQGEPLQGEPLQGEPLQNSPSLGSLVETKTDNIIIFGIISDIKTGSQDPMRYPFTYKKTEEELKREQPQIFEFLKTTFDVEIVGYLPSVSQTINYSLPSTPPKIHSFVKNANTDTIKNFFSKTDFLSLLFNAQVLNLDEILLTILKNLKIKKNLEINKTSLNKVFLNKFCQDFALLSGNDYKRLKLFLKRVQQI